MSLKELQQFLNEKKLYYDVDENEDCFIITIEWGDWKHDHGHLQYLMNYLPLSLIKREITQTNDSDCFSAIYYYSK